jgi:L-seryl-tRNA(Ser) seleniumtransferase
MGSGSLPERDLPTRVVRLSNEKMSAATLADLMRKMNPPIIVRVHEDRVLIDPRTLLPGDTDELLGAIKSIR